MSASIIPLRRDPPAHHHPEPRRPSAPMAVHAYLHSILEACNSLLRNDYEILAFFCRGTPPQMMIELADSPALRDLVRVGIASYQEQGCDADGPWRCGMFHRLGVTAFWRERGAV